MFLVSLKHEMCIFSCQAYFSADNTLDQNAIIDFHPEMGNVVMANGFSGHGLQQSPAAGRAVSELISNGCFESVDLSIFSFDRCCNDKRPVYEAGII